MLPVYPGHHLIAYRQGDAPLGHLPDELLGIGNRIDDHLQGFSDLLPEVFQSFMKSGIPRDHNFTVAKGQDVVDQQGVFATPGGPLALNKHLTGLFQGQGEINPPGPLARHCQILGRHIIAPRLQSPESVLQVVADIDIQLHIEVSRQLPEE